MSEADAKPARRKRRLKLAILSRKTSLYSTRRLLDAAKARDVATKVIDVLRCSLSLESGSLQLFVDGKLLARPDMVLPRIGASVTTHGLHVVRQLEAQGARIVNSAAAIEQSRDKLRALQRLSAANVAVPRTVLARGGKHLEALVAQVGGLPAILKMIRGTQGIGVMIAHTMAEVESILATLWELGQEILLQEFIAEARGNDLRALVVGDRVVGAMRREAKQGEFRSNLHRGGAAHSVEISPEVAKLAVRAARVLGLEVAGVDLLESRAGFKVLEVNSSPGFEGLERATGIDVAGAIIDRVVELAK